jgi:hypothetical protein
MIKDSTQWSLLEKLLALLEAHRPAFQQERVYWRAVGMVLGEVFNFDRHTVTQGLMALVSVKNNAGIPPLRFPPYSGVFGSMPSCCFPLIAPGAYSRRLPFPPAGGRAPSAGPSIPSGANTVLLSGEHPNFRLFGHGLLATGSKRTLAYSFRSISLALSFAN